jgi:putative tricarboxylic transport membrane protein
MKRLRLGSCLFLMGMAVWVGVMSTQVGVGHLELMGAGFMPFLASIVLFLLSAVVLIVEIRGLAKNEEKGASLEWKELTKPILLVVGLIAYALVLKTLGYLVTTFLWMFFMFFMLERKKWRKDIAVAAMIVIVSYIIFDKWLRLLLPPGVFHIGW